MKKTKTITSALIASLLLPAALMQACSPIPRRTLTKEEKTADMYWIYSQFGENYAPLELKEKLHGFSY